MKRTNLFTAAVLSAALIFGMTACSTHSDSDDSDSKKKYTGYTVTVTYVTSTAEYAAVAENVVKVYANYSDNSVVKVSSTDYTVSTENVSDLTVGKNTISVTYKDETKQVEVWKASQTMTTSPVLLSDYTGTRGASSDTVKYYKFGDYPQEPLADQDSIPDLSPSKAPNGYQIGQDGNYYICSSADGKYYSPEPIVWCAVSDSFDYDGHFEDSTASATCTNRGVLLVAESILDGDIAYYDDAVSTAYEIEKNQTAEKALADLLAYEEGHLRTVNEKTIYPNNYANSKIRAFLNGLSYVYKDEGLESSYLNAGFLQMAFSEKVQSETLLETTVLNDGTSGTDTGNSGIQPIDLNGSCVIDLTSENTNDKVFILSEYESTNTALGYNRGNSDATSATKKTATTYAAGKGSENTWFTRTPYYKNGCSVRIVDASGYQYPNTLVTKTTYGVVPAIVLPSSAF